MSVKAMRASRDTFLKFLQDGMSLTTYPVNALRFSKDEPELAALKDGCVNVSFLSSNFQGFSEPNTQEVILDVCFSVELDALDCLEELNAVLQSAAYTPLMDYTIPASPVQIGKSLLYWSTDIKFTPIVDDYYSHYNGVITLNYK